MTTPYDALRISPKAVEQGGLEVLRAGITDGNLHCTLRPAFSNVDAWGYMLADIVRHIANSYQEQFQMSEAEVMEKIQTGFLAALNQPPNPSETVPMS
jgi:hypothetical protein